VNSRKVWGADVQAKRRSSEVSKRSQAKAAPPAAHASPDRGDSNRESIACRAGGRCHGGGHAHMKIQSESVPAPRTCPFCRSTDIATTSKMMDTSAYWRCLACGEMWNAGRLDQSAPTHHMGGPRWRRA
jgi:hypothetical protein